MDIPPSSCKINLITAGSSPSLSANWCSGFWHTLFLLVKSSFLWPPGLKLSCTMHSLGYIESGTIVLLQVYFVYLLFTVHASPLYLSHSHVNNMETTLKGKLQVYSLLNSYPYFVIITLAMYCTSTTYLLCGISLLWQLHWLSLELNACMCSSVDGSNHISLDGYIVQHGIFHPMIQQHCIAVESMASCIIPQGKQVQKVICTIFLGDKKVISVACC